MEKEKKKKATKNENKFKEEKKFKDEKNMLELGKEINKKFMNENKSLLDVIIEREQKRKKEEDMFEEKLRKIRADTNQVIKDTEEEHSKSYARKHLTKNQSKSKIIGAKEYKHDNAPDHMKVYKHYIEKYKIPYIKDNHRKTLSELIRDIHSYEMIHRDEIIKSRILDPVTKTYGLYIV